MGPNHLSVTFDKDPKRRKFVGKLNHDCELLIWSNDTKWAKKGIYIILILITSYMLISCTFADFTAIRINHKKYTL